MLNFQGADPFQQLVVDPVWIAGGIKMNESGFAEMIALLIIRHPAEIPGDWNSLFHHGFQFVKMSFIDIAGICVFLAAEACRHADDFAENPQGPHNPDTREGNMRCADVTTSKKEILHIPGVQTAVGHLKGPSDSAMIRA